MLTLFPPFFCSFHFQCRLEDGSFSADRQGKPGLWMLDVVEGVVTRTLASAQGQLSDLLRVATAIVADPRVDDIRGTNSAAF